MGAVLSLEVEKARLKRTNHGAARQSQNYCQKIGGVHEASCLSFKPPSKFDDLSREAGALEGHLAGEALKFLRDCHHVGTQTASGYLSLWATAIALIDSTLKCTSNLFHRASLSSFNSLAGTDGKKFSPESKNLPRTDREPRGA
jgi:hypothetical protein